MTQMNLEEVIALINRKYRFSPSQYPQIPKKARSQERTAFAINHSLLHMAKSVGRIATACEAFDHGKPLDGAGVREATVKMFINTLKLASELGMVSEDLLEGVSNFYKKK